MRKENIIQKTEEILDKSDEEIIKIIERKLTSLISEKQYAEFVEMGILLPDTIRMENSLSTSLVDINNEIKMALCTHIAEYREEAKKRYNKYIEAKTTFDNDVKQKETELNVLRSEKEKLGFFAFSKKKEMAEIIERKTKEISEFKKDNEPKDLKQAFEKMYE